MPDILLVLQDCREGRNRVLVLLAPHIRVGREDRCNMTRKGTGCSLPMLRIIQKRQTTGGMSLLGQKRR